MTSGDTRTATPIWDDEQLAVINEPASSWQLVIAGPGAGKSAVACQRVAHLIDKGVPPSRILLVSFTRTAVAELRDRIVEFALAGERARGVRISTIDSHAWGLRVGFDHDSIQSALGDESFDLSITQTVELFRSRNPELVEFMGRLEHLIVDEAQDLMGSRADLVLEVLKNLSPNCGVTILADPAQAIYGFTADDTDDGGSRSLLERLPSECPRPLIQQALKNIHRLKDNSLVDLFRSARKEIEMASSADGHVARVQSTIMRRSVSQTDVKSHEDLATFLTKAHDQSTLVLFRRRADVLIASSYCSGAGIAHRLRMSGMPIVVRPWIGWLLGETVQPILGRLDFDKLWESRASVAAAPFVGEQRDACWTLLHGVAAGVRSNTLDLVRLRNIVSRARPPIELCYPELGTVGPILGTIHASKGREADTVVLVMPPQDSHGSDNDRHEAALFEEGRVYYVGATRARRVLTTTEASPTAVSYLESQRVYRLLGRGKAQLEVGRAGDVAELAHLAWPNSLAIQRNLAMYAGRTAPAIARVVARDGYAFHVTLANDGANDAMCNEAIGRLSDAFTGDIRALWSRVDSRRRLKTPATIPHLYLMAVTTVGVPESHRSALAAPYNQSVLALAPLFKGFPMLHFYPRKDHASR